ncbi:MAG: NADH-quinone oxidoreductase subunit M, partial [Deinococcus sp.]|nr:NADH-quinone oxidoreductase subunit M [Deinococcus sp.]
HMGYVLLGVASLTEAGLAGGVFQMLAHGVITGLLFLLVGLMSHRTETRLLGELGGLLKGMPILIGFLSFTIFASLGLPGLAGFIGEVLAFIGAFSGLPWVFPVVSLLGLLVTAGFFLWALQRTALGELPERFHKNHLHDLYGWEGAAVVPLAALAVLLGVLPGVAMDLINTAVVPLAQTLQAALVSGGM